MRISLSRKNSDLSERSYIWPPEQAWHVTVFFRNLKIKHATSKLLEPAAIWILP